MIGKLLFLACLALSAARRNPGNKAFSDLCPPSEIHWLLPHEYDCTQFYYCEYGQKWETPRRCAPGTEFSFSLQVCVHPRFSDCHLGPAPTDPPTDPPTTTTTAAPTPAPTTTTTAAPTAPPTTSPPAPPTTSRPVDDRCPADFSIHHLVPHESNCNLFYYCVFGQLALRQCPNGLHFNPVLQVCDWPWSAGCDDELVVTPGVCADNCNVAPWAHADCDKYYQCNGDTQVVVSCSLGLHFNPVKGSCDYICNAGCSSL